MNERIIDKIKKLIRHERSARKCSTPEEAAAFAAKIQQLCIQNKIAAEQIDVDDEPSRAEVGDEVFSPHRKKYRGRGMYVRGEDSRLMRIVAKAHFCQAIVLARTNCILIVGEEQDRAVCVEMFQFLRGSMRRAAVAEEGKQRMRRRTVRKFHYYFTLGFINVVSDRYDEMRQTNECTALVKADALVRAYVARMNLDAMFAGMRHGHGPFGFRRVDSLTS